jgi:hypothetical protein
MKLQHVAVAGHRCRVNQQQHDAVEACRAHNPEVTGSKPVAAKVFFFVLFQFDRICSDAKSVVAIC